MLIGLWVAGRLVWLWPASAEAGESAIVRPVASIEPGMTPLGFFPEHSAAPETPARETGVPRVRITLRDRRGPRYAVRLPIPAPQAWTGVAVPEPRNDLRQGRTAVGGTRRQGLTDRLGAAASLALMGLGSLVMPTAPAARPQTPPLPGALPVPRGANRWSASAWLFGRSGQAPPPLATGGQLGGSQFGARLIYRIAGTPSQPIAAFARVSGPLSERGREASLGVEAQPFAQVPVRVVAERRIALEPGAASGFAISAVGGGSVALPHGLQLDAYAQAGVIGLKRRAAFVDGAAVVTREVARLGAVPVRVGAGAWGGAQPGVSRLDIGPRVEAGVPMAGQTVRLAVDWREKVAGNASPGSGPAVTLGADF